MLSTRGSTPAPPAQTEPAAPQPPSTETPRPGARGGRDATQRAPDALDGVLARAVSRRAVAGAPRLQRVLMNQYDLKAEGGDPSGNRGSSYSKIHALLATISNDPLQVAEASYLTKAKRKATRELYEKASRFHVTDEFKEGLDEAKAKQIKVVRKVKAEMEGDQLLDRARMSELIDKMAASSSPLIRNTGVGWRTRLGPTFPRTNMVFSDEPDSRTNAQWSSGILKIWNKNFWENDTYDREAFAIGLLVHEYHHLLVSPRSPKLYPNEFIAHWKQYLAMGVALKVPKLNTLLLGPGGYNMRNDAKKFVAPEFAGPADAGALWTDFQFNKAPA